MSALLASTTFMRLLRALQRPRISLTRNLSLDLLKTARAGLFSASLDSGDLLRFRIFRLRQAAQYWIDAVSKKWLEKFAASSNI
jgi:predicted component of type VI protein secretion system